MSSQSGLGLVCRSPYRPAALGHAAKEGLTEDRARSPAEKGWKPLAQRTATTEAVTEKLSAMRPHRVCQDPGPENHHELAGPIEFLGVGTSKDGATSCDDKARLFCGSTFLLSSNDRSMDVPQRVQKPFTGIGMQTCAVQGTHDCLQCIIIKSNVAMKMPVILKILEALSR